MSKSSSRKINPAKLEAAISTLLDGMGVDLQDPNFIGTPRRVAKLYAEMLTPQANNWQTFPAEASDIVLMRSHRVYALCPHHLMPVEYRAYVAYIPHKTTVGLSKLARVVEEHLTIPIMQETLGHRIAASIQERLDPKGVAVILAGVHGCMKFRGVESDGDVVTSHLKGIFRDNPFAKSELMQLIGRP
jgi:GTP cyclohydrolase I